MSIEIHPQFKLNGFSFDNDGLKEVGYSLVKEGDIYEQSIGDFLLEWCNDYSSISVKTSGSTGNPKQISLQKRHMVNSSLATGAFFELEPGSSALHCLPTDFIAGKMMLVRAMVLGLELDYVAPSSRPLDFVSKTYDFCAMVPFQLENSMEKIDTIKTLIVGGAPMSANLKELVRNKKTNVYETYGMTETITHIAVKSINNVRSSLSKEPVPSTVEVLKTGSVETSFKTLPKVKISTDERNCLIINAPHISDNPVVTNDVVNLISENEFDWLGRFDNIINSGGIKLFPEQIEAKLTGMVENRFFVTGLPDEKLGHRLVLVVEGNIDVETLFQKVKSTSALEKFEIPKEIYTVSEFISASNNKILRKETLQAVLGTK